MNGSPEQALEGAEDRYLFVWTGDEDETSSDFLGVVDLNRSSKTFGEVVRTVQVGSVATDAHHTEHVFPESSILFANGFSSGLTFLFDLSDPLAPTLRGSFAEAGPLRHPHSFERLESGTVVATFQNEGEGNRKTGGLAELDARGRVIRYSSGYDPEVDPDVRPYSLVAVPAADRLITTGADMQGKHLSNSVQIWRLSDLTLLQTLRLSPDRADPRAMLSGEPRVLSDGKTVMVVTYGCGLYLIEGLETGTASARLVHEFPTTGNPECALAVRAGSYWVQTVPAINGLMALDVSDPTSPRVASTLELGSNDLPHWIASNRAGDRMVITGFGELANRVVLARFDLESGQLSIDPELGIDGIDFSRADWPHGTTGAAVPHGAVFSW